MQSTEQFEDLFVTIYGQGLICYMFTGIGFIGAIAVMSNGFGEEYYFHSYKANFCVLVLSKGQ